MTKRKESQNLRLLGPQPELLKIRIDWQEAVKRSVGNR